MNDKKIKQIFRHPELSLRFGQLSSNLINFYEIYDLEKWLDSFLKLKSMREEIENGKISTTTNNLRLLIGRYGEKLKKDITSYEVIYSFHTNFYHLMPMILLALGYDVLLLVADNVYKKQLKTYQNITKEINDIFKNKSKLSVISNQEKNFMYRLKNKDRNQKIFIYFDGNVGAGKYNNESKNYFYNTFLDQTLFFHKGLSFINFFMRKPLLGIILLERQSEFIIQQFHHNNLSLIKSKELKKYCNIITKEVVQNLEGIVSKNYLQWENVFFLHKWFYKFQINHTNFEQGENLFFQSHSPDINIFRYSPLISEKKYYLLDRKSCLTYPVSKKQYKLFVEAYHTYYR